MWQFKHLFNKRSSSVLRGGAVVFAIGAVGTVLLVSSHAATPTASYEAETGTISGSATGVSDNGASGSGAVKFGAASSGGAGLCATIGVAPGVKPTASNTGVPAGTTLSTTAPAGVTVSSSDWTVTANGTVIDGKDLVNKNLVINASNVTVKNSRIKAPDSTYYAVTGSGSNVTLLYNEIYTTNGALDGVTAFPSSTICGNNIHGFENIGSIETNNVVWQANYMHINNPSPGTVDPHSDVLEVRVGSNIKILGNTMVQTNPDESWQFNNSALYIGATWGLVNQVTVDGNWFGGGGYVVYTVTVGSSGSLGNAIDITNNKWYRGSYSYGPHAGDDGSSWRPRTWSNNTFEDNGQVIAE